MLLLPSLETWFLNVLTPNRFLSHRGWRQNVIAISSVNPESVEGEKSGFVCERCCLQNIKYHIEAF